MTRNPGSAAVINIEMNFSSSTKRLSRYTRTPIVLVFDDTHADYYRGAE